MRITTMFNGSSCPSGWTRYTALDGKFIRGASSYGGSGGSNTHTHTFTDPASVTSTALSRSMTEASVSVEAASHTHTTPAVAATISSESSLPSYVDVVWCYIDEDL